MKKLMIAAAAGALIAGCNQSARSDSVAAANATGNAATASGGNAVLKADAPPLQKQQALALMKERQDNYEKIGDAMKVVGRELKGDSPDLALVRQGADTVAGLAPKVPGWFPAGTGPDVGKTAARAEIWQKPEDFAARADAFNEAATAFQAVARGTDVAAITAAQGVLGKTCKACHDLYREKD